MMSHAPELAVTLSPELYRHLCAEARRIDVPLPWLVAALVLDTTDGTAWKTHQGRQRTCSGPHFPRRAF